MRSQVSTETAGIAAPISLVWSALGEKPDVFLSDEISILVRAGCSAPVRTDPLPALSCFLSLITKRIVSEVLK
jgi:hypothetical protein